MSNRTKIVRSLTDIEIITINNEINYVPKHIWKRHSAELELTALKGWSIYLNNISSNGKKNIPCPYSYYFPKTWQILKNIAKNHSIGRSYIHMLKPGEFILDHNDAHIKISLNIKKRLQIYLDIPSPIELCIDNTIQESYQYENTLVDFALENQHHYTNMSRTPWVFIVFDLL